MKEINTIYKKRTKKHLFLLLFLIIGGLIWILTYNKSIRENNISSVNQQPRGKIITYTVAEGDTLQSIADKFSVSIDTIKWENNLVSNSILEGQSLNILPVTGVTHIVEEGDTIEALALKYQANKQKIIDYPFNNYKDPEKFTLIPGMVIIIPDGKK